MRLPCAKINLGLNVVAKRQDGYHDLETVFYPIAIHDELNVRLSNGNGCNLEIKGVTHLCNTDDNLVVKAYNLLGKHHDLPGVDVTLNKHIPMQAGMGGGSSDGAYMILALNQLCSLGMSVAEMQRYAAKLGADCPFFITSQAAYAEGIGEKLFNINFYKNVQPLEFYYIVLIKPNVAVSTKEAYAGIKPHIPKRNCRDIISTMPVSEWRGVLINDFEDSIFRKLPILGEVKEAMYDSGATYASMSGSGSTIYALYPSCIDENELLNDSKISQYANKYFCKVIKKEN